MGLEFMDLPLELRLAVYNLLFGRGKAILSSDAHDDSSALLPSSSTFQTQAQRSSQLLRVSRVVYMEAQPVLYANTVFHIISQQFAGRLPTMITNGHPVGPHLQHMVWQMDCDLLRHFYPEDLRLDTTEVAQWSSLEIRCRAEAWRDSFLGDWCDREAFVKGRDQLVTYARTFQEAMGNSPRGKVGMVEDRSQLGRGRVIIKLTRSSEALRAEEIRI